MPHPFSSLSAIWRHITTYGISTNLPEKEYRKVQLIQSTAVITFLAFLYTTVFFVIVGSFWNWAPNSLGMAISLSMYLLSQRGLHRIARQFLVLFNGMILYMAWLWGPGTVLELLPIAVGIYGLILFDDWRPITFHLLLSLITLLLAHYLYTIRTEFIPVPFATLTYFVNIILLAAVTILALITFRSQQSAYEARIETANRQITDSIRYAKRIQQGLLGDADRLLEGLAGGMLFFRPRDIVSGDFYWRGQVDDKTVLVAADCTGHGVPGAFMTVLGTSILEEIVHNEGQVDPGEILLRLDAQVRHAIASKGTDTPDGMDVAIVVLDPTNQSVAFAGAKNPMLMICDGEVTYTKGAIFPIGGKPFRKPKQYPTHTFPWKSGARIYLYSDGYQDQFGGTEGRKFLSKRFRQLLIDQSDQTWEEQQRVLGEVLDDWQGATTQTDDVLVIGLELM